METFALQDLPDNLFDQFMEARDLILKAVEPYHAGMQISILEFLLGETIYFNLVEKELREATVREVTKNIINNFSIWDKRLAKYGFNE